MALTFETVLSKDCRTSRKHVIKLEWVMGPFTLTHRSHSRTWSFVMVKEDVRVPPPSVSQHPVDTVDYNM